MRKTQYVYQPLERGLKVEMPSETCLRQVIDSIGNSIIVPDAPNGSGEASGDLAYDSGFIQYWIKGNNGPVKGFYLMVLKRDFGRQMAYRTACFDRDLYPLQLTL